MKNTDKGAWVGIIIMALIITATLYAFCSYIIPINAETDRIIELKTQICIDNKYDGFCGNKRVCKDACYKLICETKENLKNCTKKYFEVTNWDELINNLQGKKDYNFVTKGFMEDRNAEILIYDSNSHGTGTFAQLCPEGKVMNPTQCDCAEWGCALYCFECVNPEDIQGIEVIE